MGHDRVIAAAVAAALDRQDASPAPSVSFAALRVYAEPPLAGEEKRAFLDGPPPPGAPCLQTGAMRIARAGAVVSPLSTGEGARRALGKHILAAGECEI
jgi:hypothetical protein